MRWSSRVSTRNRTSLGPKHVFIDPAGSVRLAQNAGEKGEPAIRQIGELLRTSLAESAFPVPLRLVITQASSTPPFYASIAELSSALEYFERPDRPGLIRAVYERAQGYQPVSDVVNEETPQPEDEKPARRDKRQPRRIPRSAIAASAAAGAAIVLWLVVSQLATRQQGSAPVAGQPKKNAGDALTGIASSVGALVDRVNPFTTSSSPQAPNPAPDAPKTIDESPRRGSASAGGRTRRSSPHALQPAAHAVTLQAADVSSGDTLPTSDATDANRGGVRDRGDGRCCCGSDDLLAQATRTSLRRSLRTRGFQLSHRASVPAENLSTLELLVGETGQVESVRLRGRPRHLGEALLVTVNLSAAKTWRFLPAVKDGRPVRYRKLVQVWPTTP